MSLTVDDFWSLLTTSQLAGETECRQWRATAESASQGADPASVAQWLVSTRAISSYQAKVLLAGRAGPFHYGSYKIIGRVESGRLGGLFRAVHAASGHRVLLKFFTGPALTDPGVWAELTRRFATTYPIVDPRITRVYELVDLGSHRFAVLEDIPGQALAERSAPAIAAPQACRVIRQIAEGLARLHTTGFAHGDARPANIWIDGTPTARLMWIPLGCDPLAPPGLDFSPTGAALLLASADYAAPEMAQPGRAPDVLTDVYNLGATLYELLAGRVPFAGGDATSKFYRHATEAIEPLEKIAGIKPDLAKRVAFMMAKNPAIRTPNMAAVIEALTPFAAPDRPPQPAPKTWSAYEAYLKSPRPAPTVEVSSPRAALDAPPGYPLGVGGVGEGQSPAIQQTSPPAAKPASAIPTEESPFADFTAPIESLPALVTPRSAPQKKSRAPLFMVGGVLAVAVVVLATALLMTQSTGSNSTGATDIATTSTTSATPLETSAAEQQSNDSTQTAEQPAETAAKQPPPTAAPLVDDDGQTIWASPTDGPPIDLKYAPAGSQVYLAIRPSELLASAEGQKVVDSLGPAAARAREELEKIIGAPLAEIDELLITFYSLESGPPQMALVVHPHEKRSAEDWSTRWQATATGEGASRHYRAAQWAYYLPPDAMAPVFVVASPAAIEEIIATPEPPLRREMEWLLSNSDQARQVTLLVAPHYVIAGDGRSLLAGDLDKLRRPIEWFFGDETVHAAALSLHFGDSFFAELRAVGALDIDPHALAKRLRDKLAQAPELIEAYVVALRPQPYGSFILRRFPDMVARLEEYTRIEADNHQAALRSYLPSAAGHNLVLGTQLVVSEPGQTGASAPVAKRAATVADALASKISVSFAKDTLENCLAQIGREIDVEIVILGPDLQLEGITKNQSFALDERDKPAHEILKIVMHKANPDGKLVYVVKPKAPGGKEALFITTRAAAEKRGEKISAEQDP